MSSRLHQSVYSQIRLALPDDAPALGAIQAASHLATYRGVMPDSVLARVDEQRMSQRFRSRLAVEAPAEDQHRVWVIEADGAIAGYAITEPGADRFLPPPGGAGELESLYLHPEVVGRGLGRALHQHAIDDLAARGFDPLILWAFAANEQALRFYERAGWTLDETGQHWLLDGVSCPIVRYRLNRRQTEAQRLAYCQRRSPVSDLRVSPHVSRSAAAMRPREIWQRLAALGTGLRPNHTGDRPV